MAAVGGLYIYPVKSCAAVALEQVAVQPRGMEGDRRWMVVDADGRFLTGREQPRLCRVRAERLDRGLRLSAPGMPVLEIAEPVADGVPRHEVRVWRDAVSAPAAPAAAEWLSAYLSVPARLVFQDDAATRPVAPDYARAGDEVSFADGFPLLLISQAALDGLGDRLGRRLDMRRFRPNVVLTDTAAHAEDGWRRLRIGRVELELVKPCTRCVFTTVDPDTAERDPDNEPLRTLLTYRRAPGGVTFGMNALVRGTGTIRLGDTVDIIE